MTHQQDTIIKHYGRNVCNSIVSSRVTVKIRIRTKNTSKVYTEQSLSLCLTLEEQYTRSVTLANHCVLRGMGSIKRLELENL